MSRRSLPLERLPHWPRFLTADLAAAYLGASPAVFAAEVKSGIWPTARMRGTGERLATWDRSLLDAAADRHAGLDPQHPGPIAPQVISDAEIRNLIRAKTTKRRPEARR